MTWSCGWVSVCRSTMINGHVESCWFGDPSRRNLGTLSCAFEFLARCDFYAVPSLSLIHCRGGLRSVLQAAPTDRLQETGGLSLILIDQKESIDSIVAVHRLLHGHAAITHHVGCKIESLHIQVEKSIADCLTPGSNFPAWPKEQPIDDLDVGGDLEDDWGVEDDEESWVVGGWSYELFRPENGWLEVVPHEVFETLILSHGCVSSCFVSRFWMIAPGLSERCAAVANGQNMTKSQWAGNQQLFAGPLKSSGLAFRLII